MLIFAIDPGLTIGYAWYDTVTEEFEAGQSKSPLYVLDWVKASVYEQDICHFIVENYLSAGHLTKEAMHTIKLVGFFEFYLDYKWGEVTLAPPQRRLSGVGRAKTMAKTRDIPGPHSSDALAHALVAARTL